MVLLPVTALVIGATAVAWRNKAAARPVGANAQASIVAIHPIVDLGTVAPGGSADATFELLNSGPVQVNIVSVTPDCGCTTVGSFHRAIAPGEHLKIPVHLVTTGFQAGQFLKRVVCQFGSLTSNDLLELNLTGTVDMAYSFSVFPGVVNFGELRSGESAEKSVYFRAAQSILDQLPSTVQLSAAGNSITLKDFHPASDDLGLKAVRLSLVTDFHQQSGPISSSLSVVVGGSPPRAITVQWKANIATNTQ